MKLSRFADAELPAIVISPKLFTVDCIRTFESEKRVVCIPDGTPIARMLFIDPGSRQSFFGENFNTPSAFAMCERIRTAERYWDITVANATPSTLIPKAPTNRRFSKTFTAPEIKRKRKGLFVSPLERIIAAQ